MTDAVQNETVQEASAQEENKLIAERRAKLDAIRKSCKANAGSWGGRTMATRR